jgi:hypothetical protein
VDWPQSSLADLHRMMMVPAEGGRPWILVAVGLWLSEPRTLLPCHLLPVVPYRGRSGQPTPASSCRARGSAGCRGRLPQGRGRAAGCMGSASSTAAVRADPPLSRLSRCEAFPEPESVKRQEVTISTHCHRAGRWLASQAALRLSEAAVAAAKAKTRPDGATLLPQSRPWSCSTP